MQDHLPLEIEGLTIGFGRRVVIDGLSFTVGAGESVAVTGRSGSGKSSLLAAVVGLVRPRSGVVRVGGTDIHRLRRAALARARREGIGVVFQFGELMPALTVEENVALPATYAGVPYGTAATRARELLERVGVDAFEARAEVLSGGERQRVALARALINAPGLILADEPTGSLDEATRDSIADLLFAQPREQGCGLLVVTHDPAIAARSDRVVRLESDPPSSVQPMSMGARA